MHGEKKWSSQLEGGKNKLAKRLGALVKTAWRGRRENEVNNADGTWITHTKAPLTIMKQ